ncbi:MAG: glycosyltransferase [Lachnospiraceae bacterium]|nr:glycosyltransferase [Lachnospiraceae bacterium]
MNICFLLSFTPNPRMNKRMRALKENHDISLIYWKRSEKYLWGDVIEDIKGEEIAIPANNGNPIKRLLPTFKFGKTVLKKLKIQKPECLYVQNVDMLFLAMLHKVFINSSLKIVYEIADIHEIIIQPQKRWIKKIIQRALRFLERKMCRNVNLLVLTSQKYYECYYKDFIEESRYLYMANAPERRIFNRYARKKDGKFTVGFIGAVRFEKQIKLLVQACEKCQVKLEIIGSFLNEELEQYCKENNVFCYGKYNYEEEISDLYGRLDCVFSGYPSTDYNVGIAVPNKLYEAIVCELPIIVSKGTYLAELVNEYGVGIAIDCDDIESYVEAINSLKDNELRLCEIANNCKKIKNICYVEEYNQKLSKRINALTNNGC